MRAKVASRVGGHAFEERFLKMDPAQLIILYTQAVEEERKENDKQMKMIKSVSEAWSKKFDNLFELQQMFTNPKMFKAKRDMMETKELREEVSEENFLEAWDQLMQHIPETYVVEEPTANVENYLSRTSDPEGDAKWEEMVSGWVETSRKFKEE